MFQNSFQARTTAVKVRFGAGSRTSAADEIRELGCSRALILSTPHQSGDAMQMAELIGDLAGGIYTKATMHTPVSVTEDALQHVDSIQADCLVSLGGGSTIGLGKAIAYRTGLPQVVIPTTYAGSEATPILGQTENGVKTTVSHPSIQPEVIIYDAELVSTLPVPMTVTSALNAMAHAAEALYSQTRNPISTMLAAEGLKAFKNALPRVLETPDDLDARGETLYGAWLCGTVLGQVGMALHHKLCHTLGGTLDLPHAETHSIILPHAIAFNARAVPEQLQPVCDIFGGTDAGQALYDFALSLNAPTALKDLGVSEADLDRAAELAATNPYWNPQPVEEAAIRALLQTAWAGSPPLR
ncbi:maleylacetate reductase [Leisingera sp. ANG-Vp]|uniref:maleylacetate reductase n=1 Tax=Leisingera sp. ANG-Vp TaxID=1577896 RepID=UPI00057FE605|nr:maleylacetate reductase [Leisingera sp. ANG-Vp]KIC21498.1 Maleylacetate reductase [Leisingera sp. ANG-Vp]